MGLAVLDAFTQVAEVLEEARRQHSALATAIEDMPSFGNVLLHYLIKIIELHEILAFFSVELHNT